MELSEMKQDQLIRRIHILEAALEDIRDCTFMLEEGPRWTWKEMSEKQSEIAQNGLDHFPVDNPVMVVSQVKQGYPVMDTLSPVDDDIPF